MYRLYYSPGACSMAVHMVLEEIGQPYELARVNFAEAEQTKPGYLAVNPRGRVPALQTEHGVLTEATAIMSYLAQRHPEAGLLPEDPWQLARAREWMAWLTSSVHASSFASVFRPGRFCADEKAHEAIKAQGLATIEKQLADIEARLKANGGHAVGSGYTLVDAYLMVFYMWARRIGRDVRAEYPSWTALAEKVAARPAIRRMQEQEGISLL